MLWPETDMEAIIHGPHVCFRTGPETTCTFLKRLVMLHFVIKPTQLMSVFTLSRVVWFT